MTHVFSSGKPVQKREMSHAPRKQAVLTVAHTCQNWANPNRLQDDAGDDIGYEKQTQDAKDICVSGVINPKI